MLTLINHILHDEGDDFAVILDLVLQKKEASVRWWWLQVHVFCHTSHALIREIASILQPQWGLPR